MKRATLLTVAVGMLIFASSSFGQVPLTFTGWDGSSWNGGGTGFYYGSVNGTPVGPGDTSPGYFCDDFSHEIQQPESWNANAFQVSNLLTNWSTLGSQTVFGTALGANGFTDYLEMAILVKAAFGGTLGSLGGIGATVDDLSEVLWCITGGPGNCASSGTNAMSANAYSLLQWIQANHSGMSLSQFANLFLYVPIPGSQTGSLGTPQEMWGNVPEGGAALLYLLLAGASCFGAMFFRSRDQIGV